METNKTKIQFKPIHEGMGFHPFSDGLPYAPSSKPPTPVEPSTGTGATAAGRPQFVTSHTPSYTVRSSKTIANPTPPMRTKPLTAEPSILRKRFFAYFLDTVLHAGFWLMVNLVALFAFDFQIDTQIFIENQIPFLTFFLISQWLFIALQEMLFENSLGKVFFGLEFEKNHRSLLARSVLFFLGLASFGLGFWFRPQDKLGRVLAKSQSDTVI